MQLWQDFNLLPDTNIKLTTHMKTCMQTQLQQTCRTNADDKL